MRLGRAVAVAWALAGVLLASSLGRCSAAGREAQWRAGAPVGTLKPLSGADGTTEAITRQGAPALRLNEGATPPAAFMYFQLVADGPVTGPLYVVVDYLDTSVGVGLSCQYDSALGDALADRYKAADDQAGGWSGGSGKWRTAIFELRRPRFAHGQNLGADFRLMGLGLTVRTVRVTSERPANWEQVARVETADVKPLVTIGAGGQLIVGGFDPAHASDAASQARALEAAVPALKQLGVTSHEGYVRWNLCETAPGKYDWSVYDRFVEVYKRHHLKWVPFLIVGSPYSLPDWYYKQPGSAGYVCLEDNQESDVQSLWNPTLRRHVAAFIKAFCDHYRPTGVIESILLGVTGNYGEAIYPATGNDWTADIHGAYHTHQGYWMGDRYAVESFRVWLIKKYGGTSPLRDAWGASAPGIAEVKPFLRSNAPNKRAWLDELEWYVGSMTDWSRFWLTETRKSFPGDIYLCTGGDADPRHGSDFGEQCKAAAAIHGGVRITNEGSNYAANFALTRWVASAGRQYGAYFSFEPAGDVNVAGVPARVYNATASGARGLHYYMPNLFGSSAAHARFVACGGEFQQREPTVRIGVYYPETFIRLNGTGFLNLTQPLRDRFDFAFVSDGQIRDGGLKGIEALVLLEGNVAEAGTWNAIADWVRRGGLLIYPEGMGKLQTVEGSDAPHQALFGPNAKLGKGRALSLFATGDSKEYRDFVTRSLATAAELSADTRRMVSADGVEDGVFVTLCQPDTLLWLNTTAKPVTRGDVTIPGESIR